MKSFVHAICITMLLATGIANAQVVKPDSIQLEAMQKLDFLIGQWKGQGRIEVSSDNWNNFIAGISVQKELDGILLILKVCHTVKIPGQENELVVHKGIDIISYDNNAHAYRFYGYGLDGHFGSGTAQIEDGTLQIYLDIEGNATRFVIEQTKSGEWHQIAERSKDRKSWHQYSEMTMKRVESR